MKHLLYHERFSVTLRFIVVLSLASGIWGTALAQPFIYGLNAKGKLSVNGTLLDRFPSKFEPDPPLSLDERWSTLVVDGSDRYALRQDGILWKNGKRIFTLPSSVSFGAWVGMDVEAGTIYCLSQGGILTADDEIVAVVPRESEFLIFQQLIWHQGSTYALRSDGSVFRNGMTTPVFEFRAGPGILGAEDGFELSTVWVTMSIDPVGGDLHALRADGQIYRGELPSGDPEGESIVALPFPTFIVAIADLYIDFEFTSEGSWKALRFKGEIYTDLNQLSPLVDLPGDGNAQATRFFDLATLETDFWAIRGDGWVYHNTNETEILRLAGGLYGELGIGAELPDLSNFKNAKPVAAKYKTTVVEGTSLSIPVLVTDTDKRSDEVLVTPVLPLPDGSMWNPEARTLEWDSPGPVGKYTFRFTVDDGVAKPKKCKHKIKIIAPDENPNKNRKPLVSKIKNVQALVGFELSFPIIVDDRDGDPLTVTVDTTSYPFNSGAVFVSQTSTFTWTPMFEDIGKVTLTFFVSDGLKTKKLKVKVNVRSGLIF